MSHREDAKMNEYWPTGIPDEIAARISRIGAVDTIYDQLVSSARDFPDRPLWNLIDEGTSRTFTQALDLVDKAAKAFANIGIGAGHRVAVMAFNREECFVTWFALSRLGAVMVPVNPAYKSAELERALVKVDANLLIAERDVLDALETEPRFVQPNNIIVIGDPQKPEQKSWDAVMTAISDNDLPKATSTRTTVTNFQFTSGTTGYPKAAMLSNEYWLVLAHVTLANFVPNLQRFYMGTGFFYMLGQRVLMNAVVSGGCVFVPTKPSARRFLRDVIDYECDYCALFELICRQPPQPDEHKSSLKMVTGVGLSPEAQIDIRRRFNVPSQEFYGLTETGLGTFMPIEEVDLRINDRSCGLPSPLRELRIVDEHGQEVEPGQPGELVMKGPGLFSGYYNDEDAAAGCKRDGWFFTGDIAKKDEEGFYYIVGRKKDMIRRAGENIAAAEVEAALRQISGIADVAVIPVEDSFVGEEVKAVIQLEPGVTSEDVPPTTIIDKANEKLSAFKVPRYISFVTHLPRTESHRIQKKHLVNNKNHEDVSVYDARAGQWC